MIALMALLFRRLLRPALVEEAHREADRGVAGRMEGHAEMDMSVSGSDSIWRRLRSPAGLTAVSNYFVMDWAAVWADVVGGLLIAGALAAWVPNSFWQGLFLQHHKTLSVVWGPLIGPAVAMLSFVCSIGNVPLAAVLWNGGISFGGVLAFVFADLIILPILNIYRKYYGRRVTVFLLATFYATMAAAGLITDLLFKLTSLEPTGVRHAKVTEAGVSLNYTTWLNVAALVLAALLVTRYFRRGGGLPMLRMMSSAGHHDHHGVAASAG
jgi:uncharacterized membrane protein YraQ (UPF0718 family)